MDRETKSKLTGDDTITKTEPFTSGTSIKVFPNPVINLSSQAGCNTETNSSMACIANTTHANMHCRPPHPMPLKIPSTVTVPVTMMSSSSPTNMNVYTSDAIAEKSSSKKRYRAQVEDKAPQQSIKQEKNHIVHGFQALPAYKPASRTNAAKRTKKRNSSFNSILYANPQTSSDDSQEHAGVSTEVEVELTKEQIDNVIDTTLPTNFSFQLPVKTQTFNSKPRIGRPKIKKTRHDLPQAVQFSITKNSSDTSLDLKTIGILKTQASPQPQCSSFSVGSGCSVASSSKTAGRWTSEEHEAFLDGLKEFGREWKKVAKTIPTRTSAQIRSHAQKYFAKLAKDEHLQAAICLASPTYAGLDDSGDAVGKDISELGSGMDAIKNEYSSSFLERVSKILDDPQGAEREVGETLDRLKMRYDELHKKLQVQEEGKVMKEMMRQRRYQNQFFTPATGHWKDASTPQNTLLPSQSQNIVEHCHEQEAIASSNFARPRPDLPSSYLSRSPVTLSSETLALHSSELIALTVLGGELYRSTSREDLTMATAPDAASHAATQGTQGTTSMMSSDYHSKTSSPTKSDSN